LSGTIGGIWVTSPLPPPTSYTPTQYTIIGLQGGGGRTEENKKDKFPKIKENKKRLEKEEDMRLLQDVEIIFSKV
jgi:hypothetical protein